MKSRLIGLSLFCLLCAACYSRPAPQPRSAVNAAQAQAEAQREAQREAHYEAQLAKADEQMAMVDDHAKRTEAILTKWEEQAARIDRILDRAEKILGRLEEKGSGVVVTDEMRGMETGSTTKPGG